MTGELRLAIKLKRSTHVCDIDFRFYKNSEYDQEVPQSQTADQPRDWRGRATQQSRDTSKTNQAKQPALSSPSVGGGGGGGGGLNAFNCYQIFALDSAVVEVQEMYSSHEGLLTIAMHHKT